MRARLLATVVAAAALLLPGEAGAQWARDPDQPLNPTTMQVCDAMAVEWRALIAGNRAQHQSCLSANERGKSCKASATEGATCSCPACESLHVEMQSLPRRMNAAVSSCREQVRAFEKQKREREEAERKRKEEAERKRKEEEARKAREAREAEEARVRAEQEQARKDREEQAERDKVDRDRSDEDRRRAAQEHADEETRVRQEYLDAVRDARAREETAERLDREAAERQRRRQEQLDRDASALQGAAQMTQIQQELLAKRQAERQAYVDQLEQQRIQRAEEALAKQGAVASALAEAYAGVKDALGANEKPASSSDLLGGFDIPVSDPTADVINQLLTHGRNRVPFAAIPFELIRTSVNETIALPDRIFDAIGDMENSDPRMLDDIVEGFPNRVFGPRNFARILTEHWVGGAKQQLSAPLKREANQRIAESFRTRNPRALFEPRRVQTPDVRVHGWWTVQPTGQMRTLPDERGVPMLLDRSNRLFRYDPARNLVEYTGDEVPGLIERHGLRFARVGEVEFKQHAIILSPIMRDPGDAPDIIGAMQQGWVAGEVLARALDLQRERK